MSHLLQVKKVNKRFPGVQALQDVDFDLKKGEIHAIVEHNGAGKSTFVKVITGVYQPEEGNIYLEGKPVQFQTPHDAIQAKIGIVTQEGSLIDQFNGIENIFLGYETSRFGFLDRARLQKQANELLAELNIEIDLTRQVQYLSPAQRKLIEIMKVMNRKPKVLILDEPTAALSDKERKVLFTIMEKLKAADIGIIFITHHLEEVFLMSDRITVFRNGINVGTKKTAETNEDEIVQMMIEKSNLKEFPQKHHAIGEKILEVRDLSDGQTIEKSHFTVHAGEIVGFFGTVGAGRTELMELLYGATKKKSGTIWIKGKQTNIRNVTQAIQNGFALIPDDRLRKGLLIEESVKHNLSLPSLKEMTIFGWVRQQLENQRSQQLVHALNIQTPDTETIVNNLSGGNKQKVSFGKWTSSKQRKPIIYIFDEPTEGVDVGARAEMYKIMIDLVKEQQAGIILVSSDLSEITGLADRIYVMKDGKIVDEVPKEEIHEERLIEASLGV